MLLLLSWFNYWHMGIFKVSIQNLRMSTILNHLQICKFQMHVCAFYTWHFAVLVQHRYSVMLVCSAMTFHNDSGIQHTSQNSDFPTQTLHPNPLPFCTKKRKKKKKEDSMFWTNAWLLFRIAGNCPRCRNRRCADCAVTAGKLCCHRFYDGHNDNKHVSVLCGHCGRTLLPQVLWRIQRQ